MKKLFKSLFVVIAATATFAGCQKEESNAPAGETKTVEFFANSIETKTVFGESYTEGTSTKYPTLWTAGDKVKVHLNLSAPSGVNGTEKTVTVELLEGTETSASAKFKAEISDYDTDAYTFYAVSPSSAWSGRSSADGRVTVVVPTVQKPLATSPAEEAQIIYAISETTEDMPSSIDMDFHHFTAYGRLSFANLASTSVSQVKIVAPADVYLSGKWNYLPADGTLAPHSEGQSNEVTIETTSTSDIWFACGPVDVSGKTLKFIVTTEEGNLEKEITFPANSKFQSGRIAKFTVDMAGVTVPDQGETTAYYQKVTSSQSDWSGKYLIVYEDGTKAYVFNATDAANGYLSATISNGTIASTSATDAVQVTIESMTGGHAIKSPNGYISGTTSDNKLNFNTSSQQLNTITKESDGVKIISNTSVLRFNSTSGQMRFRYYKSSSYTSQKAIQLYKLIDGESGGETPDQPGTVPVLAVTTATSLEIAAEGDAATIKYSVTNPVDGKSVTASADVDWINGFDCSVAGEVSFTVDENTASATRSGVVTLEYEGAESKTVTVKQNAVQSGTVTAGLTWQSKNFGSSDFTTAGKTADISASGSPMSWTLTKTGTGTLGTDSSRGLQLQQNAEVKLTTSAYVGGVNTVTLSLSKSTKGLAWPSTLTITVDGKSFTTTSTSVTTSAVEYKFTCKDGMVDATGKVIAITVGTTKSSTYLKYIKLN